jgi:hypothetical protein
MTNDEYQAMAREQRRREEEAAFRRNLQEQQERQQRQQREQEEARRLANQSRSMGQMGALPTFGAPLNAGAYQEGLWEYQRRQQQQKQQARRTVTPVTQWNGGATPVSYPQPAYNYTAARTARRRRRFIGGITSWFVHRVWPFSMILRAGNASQDASGKAKGLLALLAGCGCAALLALPQFYMPLQQQLRDTPVLVGALFFVIGALMGWLLPKIVGVVAVATVFLIGIALEIGVYAGVCWGCWAIAKAVGWTS